MNAELLISRIFPANERQSVFLPVNSWFGQRKCSRKPRPERRPWNTMNFVAQIDGGVFRPLAGSQQASLAPQLIEQLRRL